MSSSSVMQKIVALSKRRGFVFQASELYGGLNGFWDYGPLGVLLKNNIRDAWWRAMVLSPPIGPDGNPLSIVGLDTAIIQHPQTWVASGHAQGFSDPMVDCHESKGRYRADQLVVFDVPAEKGGEKITLRIAAVAADDAEESVLKRAQKLARAAGGRPAKVDKLDPPVVYTALNAEEQKIVYGPDASAPGTLTEPRQFNLMFESYAGALKDESNKVYLRPETAQGIFLDFKNVLDSSRVKVPFGIAQIGKSFRNEVNPRNFVFRSREFEQMEMEFFCSPEDSRKWYEFWVQARLDWWLGLGVKKESLKIRHHDADELAFYSTATADIEYAYPFTAPDYGELEGVAHRGAYDLTQHQNHSKTKLEYFDQEKNLRYIPHVIEPAAGLTRALLVLLCEAYTFDEKRASPEILNLHPKMAPIKAGIFPLVDKDGMPETAHALYMDLRKKYVCQYDAKQAIGKRYARMDEAGTPYCVTVDGETAKDQTVTVRDRTTGNQERVSLDAVPRFLAERLDS
jgi:glycyl-tRNA synthetase